MSTIKEMGRTLLQLIPVIHDTPRLMPIETKDGMAMEEVDVSALDLNPDTFNVDVQAGPLYATQMQEQQAQLLALASLLGPEGGWC
jgi:hypothetical protein